MLVTPQYEPASAVAVKPVARAAIAANKLLMGALLGKFIKRKFINCKSSTAVSVTSMFVQQRRIPGL